MAVTERAIDRIKAMIVAGALAPGQRLPREEELAEDLGLSRNSLREAVRALTAMRILVVRQGDGTYVSSLEPGLLLESLTFAADVSTGETALQLLQVRRMLEPQATALAAGRITDADLARLSGLLERCNRARDIEEFVACDMDFHGAIADLAGNPVLSALLRILSSRTQRVRVLRAAGGDAVLAGAQREHGAILEALAARDARLAEASAAVHIAGVERWLRAEAPAGSPAGTSEVSPDVSPAGAAASSAATPAGA
ncbi:FadR/GntR family transcriptional regulator [Streptomyces sp. YIM 98790]|uniref:FadR/GntR family transcriptional regulator n=1 Tax=Streptomyces sp. YIM 98790 TaxID=2689077 RepID=UPI00140958BF|nr:FadR/GntR family transcriptional regulator [Streptomyces sp. YIM 98790]